MNFKLQKKKYVITNEIVIFMKRKKNGKTNLNLDKKFNTITNISLKFS